MLRELLVSICWLAVAALAVFSILSLAGLTIHRAMAALQMVTPWLGVLAGVPLLVAAVLRRPALAVVSGFCVVANVLPIWAAVTSEQPARAAGPSLAVYFANLHYSNPTPRMAARQAVDSGADVLVLVELTPELVDAFTNVGVDERYPFQSLSPRGGPAGLGIYSRVPLADEQLDSIGTAPVLSVEVPAGDDGVRLEAVHVNAPSYASGLTAWKDELEAIDAYSRALTRPTVLVGDFNATRWHPPFRQILDGPLFDAHEAVGKGLTASWPADGPFGVGGPFVRLDHALVYKAGVVDVADYSSSAGSDHLPFTVTLVPEQR